jgi:zinc protease
VDERSIFYIYAIMNPENADKLAGIVREELDKLLKDGITPEELASRKAGFLQDQERQRTVDSNLTQLMGTHLQTGRTMEFTAAFEKRLADLTVEDVNKALQKHIDPERLFIVMAGDFKQAQDQ